MSFRLVTKSVTLNGEMALILRYFTEFGGLRGALRQSDWQSHNCGQLTITMSSRLVNACRGTARRPQYKYSITDTVVCKVEIM